MNRPQRPRPKKQRKRQDQTKQPTVRLWHSGPEPAPPEPILPTSDPAALIESLGRPPLDHQSELVGKYVAAVVERAATVANALASSAGLLGEG
jgi:hypothetical protein